MGKYNSNNIIQYDVRMYDCYIVIHFSHLVLLCRPFDCLEIVYEALCWNYFLFNC